MRYFEIVKPTTDTTSAATDTRDAEALTKQPKSFRPNGVEINYPIRPIEWRSPTTRGCGGSFPRVVSPRLCKGQELANTLTGLGLLERGHPTAAGQPRIEILGSAFAELAAAPRIATV
jgi:hypothetical protein